MTTLPLRPHLQKLAALTTATLTVTALAQQVTPPAVTGQPTPEQAQQIIERLGGQYGGPNGPAQIVYGAVPAGLPVTLSAPIDVLVSFRSVYGSNVAYRLLLGSAATPDEALKALDAQLNAGGWKTFGNYGVRSGFVSTVNEQYRNYYRETPGGQGAGYMANVNVSNRTGRTSIDLNVNTAPAQQIASVKKAPTSQPQSSLPALTPLPSAKIKVGYGGGSPNGLMSTAHVTGTSLSANEVLSFYNAQLKKAGWKAVTDTTNGPLRVITYHVRDVNGREALGTLGIRPWEKEGGGFVLTASVQGFKP